MRRIKFFDTTLRDGEQAPGCSMNTEEKVQFAKMLAKMNVDVIEAGFAASSKGDLQAISAICNELQSYDVTICSLARANINDINEAYESLKLCKRPRIHVFIATSEIHLKYKLKLTEEEVLAKISECVSYAKSLVDDVEFSAEDAMRTEKEFLAKAFSLAIECGATTINIPDTVGYNYYNEIADTVKYIKENVKGIENVTLSVHCHDDLGMAVANSLSGIIAGATQVEVSVNGIGERCGNASLEELAMIISTKGKELELYHELNIGYIYRISKLLSNIIGVPIPPNKAIVGANAFAHESGIHQHGLLKNPLTYEIFTPESVGIPSETIVLGKHSGKYAFAQHVRELGYILDDATIAELFVHFKELTDKKKTVGDKDLISIITHKGLSKISIYEMDSFSISTHTKGAWAGITLTRNGEKLTKTSEGNGVIDAVFKAINLIVGKNIELLDYAVNAVTEGEDALGEAVVKLRDGDKFATGRGVSTDVIEASILAYVDGTNKMVDVL